jgi:hypothetical protein
MFKKSMVEAVVVKILDKSKDFRSENPIIECGKF